jgi:hypothetical protein
MENITIQRCSIEKWQEHTNNNEFTSVFQNTNWLETLKSEHIDSIYLEFYQNKKIIAIISGLDIKNNIGHYLYFYSGVVPTYDPFDSQIIHNCYKSLKKYARQNNFFRVIAGCYDYPIVFNEFPSGYHSFKRSEFMVSPNKHNPSLHYSSQIKRNIKKSRKVDTSFSSTNDAKHLTSLFQLLKETYQRRMVKKTEPYNPLYLKNITFKSLENLLQTNGAILHIIQTHNSPHSIYYAVISPKRVYLLLLGNSAFAIKNGIPTYLYDHIIETYKEKGIQSLNLGGTSSGKGGEGLTRFKTSIGCKEIQLYGATTNFLTYPMIFLNPILNFLRIIPQNNIISKIIRKIIG